jgi:hypothetical protein
MIYKTLHDIETNNDLQNTTWQGQTMIYKTLHDIGTNYDLQHTTWHRDKPWSTKHYMT